MPFPGSSARLTLHKASQRAFAATMRDRGAAVVGFICCAWALLTPTVAVAQGATVEIVYEAGDFDVLRFDTPPEPPDPRLPPDPDYAPHGDLSEQIHFTLPGATVNGDAEVVARVTFTKPVAINIAALEQFHGTWNVWLQANNEGSSGSLYGDTIFPVIMLAGINAQTTTAIASGGIGTGIPIHGGEAGTIYLIGAGGSWPPERLAVDISNNTIITGLEVRFRLPSITPQGASVNASTFDSFKLIVYANVVYPYGSSANTIPQLLSEHGDTPLGGDVSVSAVTALPDGSVSTVGLAFDQVLTGGETSVVAILEGPETPPSGFKLTSPPVTYDIATTASFTGTVRVCLKWIEGQVTNESEVGLFHYEYGQWTDITYVASRDTQNNIVCGITSSLSPFTLFDVKYPFAGFFGPVNNLPTLNSVKAGAAVPVRFSLGRDAGLNILAPGYPTVPADAVSDRRPNRCYRGNCDSRCQWTLLCGEHRPLHLYLENRESMGEWLSRAAPQVERWRSLYRSVHDVEVSGASAGHLALGGAPP